MRSTLGLRVCTTLLFCATSMTALAGCGDDDAADPKASSAAGSGGSGASGGAGGGSGGSGGDFEMGEPIEGLPEQTWTWVDFPESRCINDTPTGIGINKSSASKNVAIFFNGGNACFNAVSCSVTANTDGYGKEKFEAEAPSLNVSMFDRTAPENPVKDWSFVYFPYCTGDVFAGQKAGVKVANQQRNFNGFANVREFLKRLVPTFADAEQVVLAGVSAGGFGVAYNYDQVAQAFGPDVDVVLIDDSGPPMSTEFLAACLQKHFRDTWGLDATLPADCTGCFGEDGSFVEQFFTYALAKYPGRRFGVISSEADQTIRNFWGFGNDDCANLDAFLPPPYSADKFKAGLEDLRDRMAKDSPTMRLYMPGGTEHVFVDQPPWTITEHGVNLGTWIRQAIDADPSWPHVPAP